MQKNMFCWLVLVIAAGNALAAVSSKAPAATTHAKRGGSHDPLMHAAYVLPDDRWDSRGTLDSIGTVYRAGDTWYDLQHNGTCGKMIAVDEMGFVHMVWTKGQTPDNSGPRHVFYQMWDPATGTMQFLSGGVPSGVVVDASSRAGYVSLAALPSGWAFPAFHELRGTTAHAAAAMDLLPGMGIFNTTRPAFLYENGSPIEIIWPKIAVGADSAIHMVSTESPADPDPGHWQRIYYSRGHPTWDNDGLGLQIVWDNVDGAYQFKMLDTAMVIGAVVAASHRSNRVAIAWPRPRSENLNVDSLRNQHNNDIHLIISEDGGYNWGPVRNVTSFAYPDRDCVSGDTAVCDRDTCRAYTDCDALFDRCDRLHLAFTTKYYYELEGTISRTFSDVWHWGEEYEEISNITHGEFSWADTAWNSLWMDAGAWQLMVQRPSLAEDTVTGYLYCAYQRYDTLQVSAAGWPMADAYVAVSRNTGRTWSEGLNVTQTDGGVNAVPGECKHEREITVAEYVSYADGEGFLNMFYIFDGDAGTPLQNEGGVTLNPARFHRIPINAIPATPLSQWWDRNIHADSTAMPGRVIPLLPDGTTACTLHGTSPDSRALRPETFKLYQNYPNPFNPVTNIQFDLVRDARVTLKVYNVLGQEVATLFDGKMLNAGVQTALFDASSLASGVYLYRLEVDGVRAARKMVLMK